MVEILFIVTIIALNILFRIRLFIAILMLGSVKLEEGHPMFLDMILVAETVVDERKLSVKIITLISLIAAIILFFIIIKNSYLC